MPSGGRWPTTSCCATRSGSVRSPTATPAAVAMAYAFDFAAAAASDEEVAAQVAASEPAAGIEPREWPAIGREERGDDE